MLGIHRAAVGGYGIYSMPTLPMEVDSRKPLCKSLKTGKSAQPAEKKQNKTKKQEAAGWML